MQRGQELVPNLDPEAETGATGHLGRHSRQPETLEKEDRMLLCRFQGQPWGLPEALSLLEGGSLHGPSVVWLAQLLGGVGGGWEVVRGT